MSDNQTLTHRVVKGGFWVFALRIIGQLLSFIRLTILARMLSPNDFGLMGIALLTLSILETFSQPGFKQALIQKKDNIENYLDSAWTVLIIRGCILALTVYLIAPYTSMFFKSPQAKPIIQVMGLSILIQAFTNIGVIYFQKELEFNKQFIYELTGTIADFIVAVGSVFILKNVWALVLGLLAGNCVKCVTSYIIHPYRPHFTTDFSKAKELWNFGRWVMGSSILVFLITHGDDIFVGKFLGATALGLYQLAYRISNMPATEITHVISQVTFPAYSKLQDNIPKLREAYLRVLQLTAILSFPVAGSIFVLAPDFTKIFLGEKWMPMVPAMQILVFEGLLRSVTATTGPVFAAVGQPRIETTWQIVRLVALIIFIYPCTVKWDITGTSIAVFVSMFISNIGFCLKVISITVTDFKEINKILISPMSATLFAIFAMYIFKIIPKGNNILCFLMLISVGVIAYIFIIQIFNKYCHYSCPVNIKQIFNSSLMN